MLHSFKGLAIANSHAHMHPTERCLVTGYTSKAASPSSTGLRHVSCFMCLTLVHAYNRMPCSWTRELTARCTFGVAKKPPTLSVQGPTPWQKHMLMSKAKLRLGFSFHCLQNLQYAEREKSFLLAYYILLMGICVCVCVSAACRTAAAISDLTAAHTLHFPHFAEHC